MKLCNLCKTKKSFDSFYSNKSKKDGLNTYCKECSREKSRLYRQKNIEEHKQRTKNWKKKNKKKIQSYRKRYYKKNKSKELEQSKKYQKANRAKISQKEKEYRNKDRIAYLEKRKKYFQKHKNKHAKYVQARRKKDPTYRIVCSLRGRLKALLKGKNKSASTMRLVGCSVENLWLHLESQFTEGMTRDNHGKYGWHIDHIIPCSSFDLSDPEQQRKCFHYNNLQPLWAQDNIRKSNKIICPNTI